MKILPSTELGKWSAGLAGMFVAFLLFTTVVIVGLLGQSRGDAFFDNLFISIPMLVGLAAALGSFAVGGLSIWKYRERSLLVISATLLGFLITLFALGEFISPH